MEYINIGVVGCISSGKSTLLNCIFESMLSPVGIDKTTMLPTKYSHHTKFKESTHDTIKNIFEVNKKDCTTFKNNLSDADLKISEHLLNTEKFVFNKTYNNSIPIFNVIDFPGLNDSMFENNICNYFFDFLEKCHIIIFVVDIKSCLGTNDEKQLLENIRKIRSKQQRLSFTSDIFIVINKWDSVTPEYKQLRTIIKNITKQYIYDAQFIKLSAMTRYNELFSDNTTNNFTQVEIDDNWEKFVKEINSVIMNHIPSYYLYNLKLYSQNVSMFSNNFKKYNTVKYLHDQLHIIEKRLDCKYCEKDTEFLYINFKKYTMFNLLFTLTILFLSCMLTIIIIIIADSIIDFIRE